MKMEENKNNTENLGSKLKFEKYYRNERFSEIEEIICCRKSVLKILLTSILCLSIILPLLIYWLEKVKFYFCYSRCQIAEATHLAIINTDNILNLSKIDKQFEKLQRYPRTYGLVIYNYLRYKIKEDTLKPLRFKYYQSCNAIIQMYEERRAGQTDHQLKLTKRQRKHGKCSLALPLKSYISILTEEVLGPFFIFQIFSCSLWFYERYYIFAAIILVISIISVIITTYEIYCNIEKIRKLSDRRAIVNLLRQNWANNIGKRPFVSLEEVKVNINANNMQEIIRNQRNENNSSRNTDRGNGEYEAVENQSSRNPFSRCESEQIIPGDIIKIENDMMLPCDVILMDGTCKMDESLITGESSPILKNPLSENHNAYDPDDCPQYTLYEGSIVKELAKSNDTEVLAFVIRTGFSTRKGGFFRYLLYPKNLRIDFYFHAYIFIFVFFLLSIAGLIIQIKMSEWSIKEIIIGFLDLITVIVPPILPSAMTFVVLFSIIRLKNLRVTTLEARKMLIAGTINLVCFDKTGTITESDFNLENIIVKSNDDPKKLNEYDSSSIKELSEEKSQNNGKYINFPIQNFLKMKECMATCHSLIPNLYNRDIFDGDPLEKEMFKYSQFNTIHYKGSNNLYTKQNKTKSDPRSQEVHESIKELEVIKTFEFNSQFQRKTSIVNRSLDETNSFILFSKGSPNGIENICIKGSIPASFHETVEMKAKEGKKVIALAYKDLDSTKEQLKYIDRTEAESSLQFLGLLIFENKLKYDKYNTINQLRTANINTVMITGDVIETANYVSKECGILNKYFPVYLGTVLKNPKEITQENIIKFELTNAKNVANRDELPKEVEIETKDNFDFKNHKDYLSFDCLTSLNPQFSISRDLLRKIFKDDPQLSSTLAKNTIERSFVFAGMDFDDKANVIVLFQKLGYKVAMCGDGSNDIKALNQADIGISFNNAQASLGSSFSIKEYDISFVLEILKEGRAVLTNSIECFKFLSLYSLIQFLSLIILNSISSQLTDNQLLFEDMVIILPAIVIICLTGPSKKLSRTKAVGSLFSLPILISVIGHILVIIGSQIGVIYLTKKQSFYIPFNYNDDFSSDDNRNKICHLNTILFLVSIFQIIGLLAAFSFGSKFRKSIYHNYWFIIIFAILFSIACVAHLIYHYDWVIYLFNFENNSPFPIGYKYILLIWFGVNILVFIVYEQFVVNKIIMHLNQERPLMNHEIHIEQFLIKQ